MEKTLRYNILIAESSDYSPNALACYRQHGQVIMADGAAQDLGPMMSGIHVLVVRLKYQIHADLLQQSPELKYIISPTTGLDHIDRQTAQQMGIEIISLQGDTAFLTEIPSTAEHTWALLLALMRHVPQAVSHVRQGGWNRNLFRGNNLKGKKMGIFGFGRVGKQVNDYARAFGMETMAYDTGKHPKGKVLFADSATALMRWSDIISIHIPLEGNHHYINDTLLSQVKPGCLLINTSRGLVWDETAVANALLAGRVGGIATDVLGSETTGTPLHENPLVRAMHQGYRVLITPHIAGATLESMQATEAHVAHKWAQLIQNHLR